MRDFADLWEESTPDPDGDAQRRQPPPGLTATGGDGRQHQIRWVFRHQHEGEIVCVSPRRLAPFRATPDHPVLATHLPGLSTATYIPAGKLTTAHFLAVPRPYEPLTPPGIHGSEVLRPSL